MQLYTCPPLLLPKCHYYLLVMKLYSNLHLETKMSLNVASKKCPPSLTTYSTYGAVVTSIHKGFLQILRATSNIPFKLGILSFIPFHHLSCASFQLIKKCTTFISMPMLSNSFLKGMFQQPHVFKF